MTITITIKTLDSRNYDFEVDDDLTVLKFKQKIEPTVNVSASEQRLIFCGRVLQDGNKLLDYDCHGKVIHLVQRPPPSLRDCGNDSGTANNDSNNNNDNVQDLYQNGQNQARFHHLADANNFSFSAMTLPPDTAINVDTIQQLVHGLFSSVYPYTVPRWLPDGSIEFNVDIPAVDIQRRLVNVGRLLRSTFNALNECRRRLSTIQNGPTSSGVAPNSNDDMPNIPTSESIPSSRPDSGFNVYDQLMTCLARAEELFRPLSQRHRELLRLSTPASPANSNNQEPRDSSASTVESSVLAQNDVPSTSAQDEHVAPVVSESTYQEARVLGQFVPRILHHLGHVYHALSDFSTDFSRHDSAPNRNARSTSTQQSESNHQRQGEDYSPVNNQHSESGSAQPNNTTSLTRETIERAMTITSTISSTPTVSTSSWTDRPAATIVVTSEASRSTSNQNGQQMRIPQGPVPIDISTSGIAIPAVSIGIPISWSESIVHSTVVPPSAAPTSSHSASVPAPEPAESASEQPSTGPQITVQQPPLQNNGHHQEGQQSGPQSQNQNRRQPVGVISGTLQIPFDCFLPCNSRWARPESGRALQNRVQNVPRATETVTPSANRQPQTVPRPANAPINQQTQTRRRLEGSNNMGGFPINLDFGNLLESSFAAGMNSFMSAANVAPGPGRPASVNIMQNLGAIPEIARNAAMTALSQYVTAAPPCPHQAQHTTNRPLNQSRPRTQADFTANSATRNTSREADNNTETMDVDDDSDAEQFVDASDGGSCNVENKNRIRVGQPSSSRSPINRDTLNRVLEQHRDWIPIIEEDFRIQERLRSLDSRPLSDGYVNSVPKKKRRLLTINSDSVSILQPSSARAIESLLVRAFDSANAPARSSSSVLPIIANLASDPALQAAYDEHVRFAVEERLKSDSDYDPSKFEHSSKYFK